MLEELHCKLAYASTLVRDSHVPLAHCNSAYWVSGWVCINVGLSYYRTSVVLGALHWACCANVFLSLLFGLSNCVVCVALLGGHAILEMAGVPSKSCDPAETLACVLQRLRWRGGRSSCSRWRGGPLSCCFANIAFFLLL